MTKKKTEKYKQKVQEKYKGEFEVLNEYGIYLDLMEIKHIKCGKVFKAKAGTIVSKRGRKCPTCNPKGRVAKSHEEFKKEFKELLGRKYTLLSKYEKSNLKVKVQHNEGCGNIFYVTPNSLQSGRRCPKCNGNEGKRKTTEQFRKEVYELVKDEYTVLGEYVNREQNIEIKHNKCGRVYTVEPGNFLAGSRCIECYHDSQRLTIEQVEKYILDSLGEDYEIISEYKNMQKPIQVYHAVCGTEYSTRLTDIVYKRVGCKNCSQSRGEDYVRNYLEGKGITYTPQKRFDDLKDESYLFIDFYLPELNILIEYQGEQHFRPKNFGGISEEEALENFKSQQRRDNIKREYAKNNGYILWEPCYKLDTYSKVTKYLDDKLKTLVVTQGDFTKREVQDIV